MCFGPNRKIQKYFNRNPDTKLIVVAGSFGRRSAIQAIGSILGQALTVGVGINHSEVLDVVIMDYNSSSNFPKVTPDFVIITSCRSDIEARKYFELANGARHVLVNYNDVPQIYSKYLKNPNIITYGDEMPANYYFENADYDLEGWKGCFVTPDNERIPAHIHILGEHNLRPITMAVALGHMFGVPKDKIIEGAESIHPLMGHLKPGRGINGSIVVDDSADTSSISVNLALRAIYPLEAPSRVLVLGGLTPGVKIDPELVSQVLVMDPMGVHENKGAWYFFRSEVDLMAHLAKRMEEGGIVLLEYPLLGIIDSYIM
ncbi:MAG: hypothetical protein LBT19_02770 [Candidatus Nomurabacteria bacterium]|jgi:UDP-N-acetylmuramate-alanine ligase|nr:hypothetical protein [Candidatus Nomurabacteria bacterium]